MSLTPLEEAIAAIVLQAAVPADEEPDWLDRAHSHDAAHRITRLFLEGPLHVDMLRRMTNRWWAQTEEQGLTERCEADLRCLLGEG